MGGGEERQTYVKSLRNDVPIERRSSFFLAQRTGDLKELLHLLRAPFLLDPQAGPILVHPSSPAILLRALHSLANVLPIHLCRLSLALPLRRRVGVGVGVGESRQRSEGHLVVRHALDDTQGIRRAASKQTEAKCALACA